MGMTYLFMIEFDRDHDNKITASEWTEGFQSQGQNEGGVANSEVLGQ